MAVPISEISYGYAFTENLVQSSRNGPTKAPKFPTLIEEAGLGYDVKIELPSLPVFFQFKIERLLKRRAAREIANRTIPRLSAP